MTYKDVAGKVWPNIDELLGEYPETRLIPSILIDRLKDRWAGGAEEYTMNYREHDDGRAVNDCMDANSWRDAEEEVVDAIFNLLVANFKVKFTAGPDTGMIGMLVMLHAMLERKLK